MTELKSLLIPCFFPAISFFLKDWSVVISTTALLVATTTLYFSHLKTFSPRIYSTGRYSLSINKFDYRQLSISLGLNFSNDGAKSGVIEDIYVKIYNTNIGKLLIPTLVILDKELNLNKDPSKTLKAEPFSAFEVKAKESISRTIMFVPYSYGSFELPVGSYRINVYAKTSASKKDKLAESVLVEIDQADLDAIKIPMPIPPEGALIQVYSREKIIKSLDEKYKKLERMIK